VELLRRGHEVYYFQEKKVCDFVVREGAIINQAIQVCRTMLDESTRKREMDGLKEAMNTYGLSEGLILTEDEEPEHENDSGKITIMPVWKWMLK
jgi:hypothetical protein